MVKNFFIIFALYCSCFLIASCNSNLPEKKFPKKQKATGISKEQIGQLTLGNSQLAWDIYQKLTAKNAAKNIIFSPYSISTALAMTYAGAKSNTAKEMEQTLHFPAQNEKLHAIFSGLVDAIEKPSDHYKLSIANALWGQKGYSFLPQFLNTTGKNYGAGLYEVDFIRKAEEARGTINNWVEHRTNDLIKELLPANSLNQDVRLVLTNAIYFKGDWQTPFNKNSTRKGDFYIKKNKKEQVTLMFQDEGSFYCYEGKTFKAIKLAYKGDNIAMNIFLPKSREGLADLEKQLDIKTIQNIGKKMTKKSIVVILLPKFKATYEFEAKDILKSLGMKDAFIPKIADFSAMDGTKKLYIDKVFHKAFVNVDEKGTEAAAASAVVMKGESARPDPFRFIAEHPFFFTISDIKTGSILFIGRVVDPR